MGNSDARSFQAKMSEVFGLEMVVPFLLGDSSPVAQHYGAQWMYANYAAMAYGGFLEKGRGVLIGPFVTSDDRQLLDRSRLKEALFETGEHWSVSVSYLAAAQPDFTIAIAGAGIRNIVDQGIPALDRYNPEVEVPILL